MSRFVWLLCWRNLNKYLGRLNIQEMNWKWLSQTDESLIQLHWLARSGYLGFEAKHVLQWMQNSPTLVWLESVYRTATNWLSTRRWFQAGAIIGDGDRRKSWDPRAPMIWDNFSIFRTNCAILTTYIRANPRTCRGFSRDVVTLLDQMARTATAMGENNLGNKNRNACMKFDAPS